jgi:ABC-type bacteriocin/lantibiotic exporter with double-glycine peptidase domain
MAFPVPDPGNPALDSLPFHEETPTTSGVSPFVRLNRLIWPERRDLGIVILFAIGVGLLNLVAPLVTTAVLNTVVLGTLIQQLLILCTAMLFGLMLSALMQGASLSASRPNWHTGCHGSKAGHSISSTAPNW